MSGDAVVELDEVTVAFGDRVVLDRLSIEVPRNQTTVIVGRSGSGKTVLLKVMLGLIKPTSGRVRLFGQDLADVSEPGLVALRQRMGMLFQNYALFDSLSVEANIEFPLREREVERSDAETVARQLIRVLGLGGSEEMLPAELSGGMRKRVGLARALATHPEVVLLDEPTTGLDPLMVEQVDQLILRAKQQQAMSIVIISHDLASVRRLADRVAFLHEGKIAFTGTYDELAHSEIPAIRDFLGRASPPSASRAARAPTAPIVELVNVHKTFGDKHVLRGLDLSVYPGRITVLVGASGSGKSLITRHILGLTTPDSGAVRVFGQDIAGLSPNELEQMRRHFALVFQHAALLDWLDVEENIAFPLVERGLGRHEIRERVEELVTRLELVALRHRMPGELSAGERKRVAVARAVALRPDVLIYDEPTTGQDPVRAREIERLIVQTQQQLDLATLVISHDMPATFRIAHTIAVLHDGKIVAVGTPAELAASRDPYVRHFLDVSVAA